VAQALELDERLLRIDGSVAVDVTVLLALREAEEEPKRVGLIESECEVEELIEIVAEIVIELLKPPARRNSRNSARRIRWVAMADGCEGE
jgi:hypothetical protein